MIEGNMSQYLIPLVVVGVQLTTTFNICVSWAWRPLLRWVVQTSCPWELGRPFWVQKTGRGGRLLAYPTLEPPFNIVVAERKSTYWGNFEHYGHMINSHKLFNILFGLATTLWAWWYQRSHQPWHNMFNL
jgi:hypothetical protein